MGGQLKIDSYSQCNQFYFLNIYYFNPYDFGGGDIQGGQSPVILVKYTELYTIASSPVSMMSSTVRASNSMARMSVDQHVHIRGRDQTWRELIG